jgi:small subunit ribosomal protein S14
MAKLSVRNRNEKRIYLAEKFRVKRAELKEKRRLAYASDEIPWDIQRQLQELPRNSNRTRIQKRCRICGRAHAVYKKFGMCRLCLRLYALKGCIPGLVIASW